MTPQGKETGGIEPLVQAFPYDDPIQLFQHFYQDDWAVLLHSKNGQSDNNRYSFIAIDPFCTIISTEQPPLFHEQNHPWPPLVLLDSLQEKYRLIQLEDLPPFQGGVLGYLSYDAGLKFEKISSRKKSSLPEYAFACYDLVIAFDHQEKSCVIFSSGFPKTGNERISHAKQRLAWLTDKIQKPLTTHHCQNHFKSFVSNFTAAEYLKIITQAKNYIVEGDIFEVNLSQQFTSEVPDNFCAYCLLQQLQSNNPAPFSSYFKTTKNLIISMSPERFIRVSRDQIFSSPIKGTVPRSDDPIQDKHYQTALIQSEKDRAENIMIVDLLRNDLSKICLPHTVKVKACCELQTFTHVHHLVSTIAGKLKPNTSFSEIIQATFPGGSITGAPKIRAMEIIDELEPHQRGPYCGSLFYLGFNGEMDSSILIRTFYLHDGQLNFASGGAITLDSCAEQEYQETLIKAATLQTLLQTKVAS